ncbi:putative calcium channel subunit mid1 protein [Neofusicoccum parvum]|uniref:Calcium channel subunit mid1 protein n=1 Tax=Neofusicoccum parvum TaxID=310453 RepID=A0ACB5S2L2_9PEZI|nr:putative calcium channel subunit mid1 protein [Neofusicoccum parvum]
MACPKLSPLQSRLAASLTAVALLILIYLSLGPANLAYAAATEDHNHDRLEGGAFLGAELEADGYEPEFVGVSRDIIGRQDGESYMLLSNNQPGTNNVEAGSTMYYRFDNSSVWGNLSDATPGLPEIGEKKLKSREWETELRKRGVDGEEEEEEEFEEVVDGKVVLRKRQNEAPPQLTLYISTTDSNKSPGPDSGSNQQSTHVLTGGFVSATVNASSNVYIGVAAPSPLPDGYSGQWQYEVAVSIDASYHQYNYRDPTDTFVFLVDSDTTSALFVTDNLTSSDPGDEDWERWMKAGNPFQLFAYSYNFTAIKGVERSYCGLERLWNEQPTAQTSGMTTRGLGNKPKEQFYVEGLNGSTPYHAFPVMYGNSTAAGANVVGGGGQVWSPVNFTTKADGNCQVIFNMTFCSEVAYAVPSNPNRYNRSSLTTLYDEYASDLYQNFNYSLQQIPCNTTNTAQYSLAKTCDDCAHDYKNWLCAVTIPRCEDFSAPDGWLQPRNIAQTFINGTNLTDTAYGRDPNSNSSLYDRLYANSSRNTMIDEKIMPGPYKEVLPCEDLCYSLIQSCPASFGFACPVMGKGLERSYGNRLGNGNGNVTCSYLGAVYYVNAGARLGMGVVWRAVLGAVGMALWVWL